MMSEGPSFVFDLREAARPLLHVWEHTVGSGHATLALRADWQTQMTRCRRELGFRHVRFHGLLNDDMGTLICQSDELVYSFFNADRICDFLLSIGMRPFMELSFMPSTLSSGGEIVFHYRANVTPPKDYSQWETLVHKLVGHWVERYGITEVAEWFFEIWNEPNLTAFWTGDQAAYFRLYETSARAIKSVDPRLRVGGPATAANAWIPEFLDFCAKNSVPNDFISTHHYPTDAFGKPGDDTIAQLAASRPSVLRDQARAVKEQVGRKPLYYTEWSTSSNPFDDLHDGAYAAAMIVKTVMEAREFVEGYSYWVFSDIFEENYFSSAPFHGGFGLMNIYGIPKPAYRAYELLHRLGDEIFSPLESSSSDTVDLWCTRRGKTLKILATNSALPRHPVKTEAVRVRIGGTAKPVSCFIERIDDDHANSRTAWERMGSPDTLRPNAVETLEAASSLVAEVLPFRMEGESISLDFLLPPQGTACVTLEFA